MSHKILVVEDHEDNRRIIHDLLTAHGFDVVEAVTGLEGVHAAKRQNPALILMDIQLPEIDGYEATRRIKSQPELKHIPIIIITSYALSGDDLKAYQAGCDEYVSKPYSPRKLLTKIRKFLPETPDGEAQ
jgi:two-component system cell cycle response regulator DivK